MIIRYNPGRGQYLEQSMLGEYVAHEHYEHVAQALLRLWKRRLEGVEQDFWVEWDEVKGILERHGLI